MKKETIHPRKLIAAAVVAIILALVSTELTNYVNSAVLLALLAVGTLVGRELVETVLIKIQDRIRESEERIRKSVLSDITGEHKAVDPKELTDKVHRSNSLKRFLASRWSVPLVFAVVALVFVGVSFGVGRLSYQKPKTVIQHTTRVEKLTSGQIEQLKRGAVDSAAANTKSQLQKTQSNDYYNTQSLVSQLQQRLDYQITLLSGQTAKLSQENRSLSEEVQKDSQAIAILQSNIAKLQNSKSGSSNSSSTSTTTSTAPSHSP